MQLIGMLDSPYVRRTAICLRLLDLPFSHQALSVFRNMPAFRDINPVIKAPTLVCDDGAILMDSTLILAYAQALAPQRPLLPAPSVALRDHLSIIGLALAVSEKAVQIVYERGLRPADKQHAPWLQRVTSQLDAALTLLNQAVARSGTRVDEATIGLAAVSAAVAWRFVEAELPGVVSGETYPALTALAKAAEALNVFRAIPHGDACITYPASDSHETGSRQ